MIPAWARPEATPRLTGWGGMAQPGSPLKPSLFAAATEHVPGESPYFTPWSDEDVERLLRLIESGTSVDDLTRSLGREEVDVAQKAHYLGVHLPGHEQLPVLTRTSDSSRASATIHYVPFKQRFGRG